MCNCSCVELCASVAVGVPKSVSTKVCQCSGYNQGITRYNQGITRVGLLWLLQVDLAHFLQKSDCECLNEEDEHPLEHALTVKGGFLQSDCDEQVT